MNILAHCSFIGETGFAYHTREFLTRLSRLHTVRVRNYTVGNSWTGWEGSGTFKKDPTLTYEHHTLLHLQSLKTEDGSYKSFLLDGYTPDFLPDVNLVLASVNHEYFWQPYDGYNIAYTVWESTRYPEAFFKILLTYDELWVPTQWQKEISIAQGYPEDRVFVVNEGVDINTFYPRHYPRSTKNPTPFRFLLMGRWDDRKSIKEIVSAWVEEFGEDEDVELFLNVDNPFSVDGLDSTEDRLAHYNLNHSGIKVNHFLSRDRYVKLLQAGDVFLSCARAEGWNLPLIEAMACGIPSIYSKCSGQLEFTKNGTAGVPVDVLGEIPASKNSNSWGNMTSPCPGNYYEPDFKKLRSVMRDVYENYGDYKKAALEDALDIRSTFTWQNAAMKADARLKEIDPSTAKNLNRNFNFKSPDDKIVINFNDGAYCEVVENTTYDSEYRIEFIDKNKKEIIHYSDIKKNMWSKTNAKYFVDWTIRVYKDKQLHMVHDFNPKGKLVYLVFDSSSLGDTIAWVPYAMEFKKKYGCEVAISTFHNYLFEGMYPELHFVETGTEIRNTYATYKIGWFEDEDRNPIDPKTQPLQKTICDILGLKYKEIVPKVKTYDGFTLPTSKKYVTLAIQSTAQAKYWNVSGGWSNVVQYLKSKGYDVVVIDQHSIFGNGTDWINVVPDNAINKVGVSLKEATYLISNAEFHMGISSGLSWLAFGLDVPVLMVSGFTDPSFEFNHKMYRVHNDAVCNSCFNKEHNTFDKGNWTWCPEHENTPRMFECTKSISVLDVVSKIDEMLYGRS